MIKSIKAREILDSRGSWTVEVDLETSRGVFTDSAPSGASTGKYEAKPAVPEIAVRNANEIVSAKLRGMDVLDQNGIDKILKGLNIGANTTTAVSMAVCRAGAAAQKLPLYQYVSKIYGSRTPINLPKPAFNMINGGAHATNDLDFQEFMIVPAFAKASAGKPQFKESLRIASDIYQELRKKLGKNVGDEGGFTPSLEDPEQVLKLLSGDNVKIIIDAAASQFSDKAKKIYNLDYYKNLIEKYPIIGLEDPFGENDWHNFQEITKNLGKKISIIGDDLLVTNPERIKEAHQKMACNCLLLKINQIGTVSEALEAAKLAKLYGWKTMVSHRSGETNDDFIADFAVGIGADYIKAGAPARGERAAKYNRLLRIEEELS